MKRKEKTNVLKNNRGITLIALVVTIIVLIILAGVSINLIFNDYGIVTRAQNAKQMQQEAQVKENIQLKLADLQMEKILKGKAITKSDLETIITQAGGEAVKDAEGNITGVKVGDTIIPIEEITKGVEIGENTPTEKSEVENYRDAGTYMTEATEVTDSDGNIIKVPKGFKIASDSGINVTEGIVIEDKDIKEGIGNNRGNQYVWIPVGTGIKKSDGTTVDITLGRYVFADGTNHKDAEGNVLAKGTPILKQNVENYENETGIHVREILHTASSDYEFKELKTNREGVASSRLDGANTTALSILNFKTSVENNKGYYLARYEASYGTDGKANSKVSNTYGTTPTEEGALWNKVTQINAAIASRGLYEESIAITDLVNSYAWDTAIVYIQAFADDIDYSYEYSKNKTLTNTGVNGDEVCKINDMASNTSEWITEYSTFTSNSFSYPCTLRGGYYNAGYSFTSHRFYNNASSTYGDSTFRFVLYM